MYFSLYFSRGWLMGQATQHGARVSMRAGGAPIRAHGCVALPIETRFFKICLKFLLTYFLDGLCARMQGPMEAWRADGAIS